MSVSIATQWQLMKIRIDNFNTWDKNISAEQIKNMRLSQKKIETASCFFVSHTISRSFCSYSYLTDVFQQTGNETNWVNYYKL